MATPVRVSINPIFRCDERGIDCCDNVACELLNGENLAPLALCSSLLANIFWSHYPRSCWRTERGASTMAAEADDRQRGQRRGPPPHAHLFFQRARHRRLAQLIVAIGDNRRIMPVCSQYRA